MQKLHMRNIVSKLSDIEAKGGGAADPFCSSSEISGVLLIFQWSPWQSPVYINKSEQCRATDIGG